MNTLKISFLILTSLLVIACKNDSKSTQPIADDAAVEKTKEQPEKKVYKAANTSAVFKDTLVAKGFDEYIVLKTALVNTNFEAAALAADQLMTTMANQGVEEQALLTIQTLKEATGIDGQRKAFSDLTPFMEAMIADAITDGTVFKQFCPMANKNTGAYWLSNSKEIYNPYFGDRMLACGSVTEQLTSK